MLRVAAGALRAHGPDGLSVARVMAEAGLTHKGSFYAHFPSKEALIAAAIEEAFEDVGRRHRRRSTGKTAPQALGAYIDAYLSPRHRDGRRAGRPIAALASDMPRQGPLILAAYDRGAAGLLARVEGWLPKVDPRERAGVAAPRCWQGNGRRPDPGPGRGRPPKVRSVAGGLAPPAEGPDGPGGRARGRCSALRGVFPPRNSQMTLLRVALGGIAPRIPPSDSVHAPRSLRGGSGLKN